MINYEWIFSAGNRRTGSTVHYHITREIIEYFNLGRGFGAVPGGGIDPIRGWSIYEEATNDGVHVFRTHRPTDQIIKVLNTHESKNNTRCIYIYRDPRDSMVSYMMRDGGNLKAMLGPWMKRRSLIDQFWRDRDPVLCSRYEDNIVHNDITAETIRIAEFLGLKDQINTELLEYLQNKYNRESVENNPEFYKETQKGWAVGDGGLKPFMSNHIQSGHWGRWIDYFTPDENKFIDDVLGNYLQERGYPLYAEVKSVIDNNDNPYKLIH